MGHIFVQYEVDGEERWAIWSTVVEAFIIYDATAEEAIEHEAQEAYERRLKKCKDYVKQIRNGGSAYRINPVTEEDRQELKEMTREARQTESE